VLFGNDLPRNSIFDYGIYAVGTIDQIIFAVRKAPLELPLHSGTYLVPRAEPKAMRVCYIALVSAALLLSNSAAVTAVTRAQESKLASVDATRYIDTASRRFLRTQDAAEGDEEERGPVNLTALKDMMKLDDLLLPKNLDAALGKTNQAKQNRKTLFDGLFAVDAPTRKAVLDKLFADPKFAKLRSSWTRYKWGKALEYERAEAAAARLRPN
jgi:hypothetical protein